jgi:hypothetical protein
MTYTYKISRRLAISRKLVAPTAVVLLVACTGDTTAPEASEPNPPSVPTSPAEYGVRVLPRSVTAEVDQRVRFRGEPHSNGRGIRLMPLRWQATGGTITPDGVFMASRPGTYRVIGGSRFYRPDTSIIVVVPKQPKVERVRVTPRRIELAHGTRRTFTAVGRLPDGSHTAIRVNWSATGGTISEAGVYVAGDEEGTFRVVAKSLRGGKADTIPVVVRKAPKQRTPEPTRVVLRPSTATVAPTSSLQFAAFGRTESGDSIAVDVFFEADGGTITESGLYTAGSTVGTYRVIARAARLADTSIVTLARTSGGGTSEPTPSPGPGTGGGGTLAGIPFGHFKEPNPGSVNRSGGDLVVPMGELDKLPATAARGGRVVVNVVGGGKCAKDASGQFQMSLWKACWSKNLTAARRNQLLAYSDSGVVVGTYLIDEPNLVKRWGVITPAMVCHMAAFARGELPGIPVIVRTAPSWLGDCPAIDAGWAQYGSRRGVEVNTYREQHLADAKRLGYSLVFSLNGLNDDGYGTDMTPAQVLHYGTSLMVPGVCAFFVWEYATTWSERPEIRAALDSLGRIAATLPRRECRRQG